MLQIVKIDRSSIVIYYYSLIFIFVRYNETECLLSFSRKYPIPQNSISVWHEIFVFRFFSWSVSPGPLSIPIGAIFEFLRKFAEVFATSLLSPVSTTHKMFASCLKIFSISISTGDHPFPPLTVFEAGPIALNSFRQILNHWPGDIVDSGLWLSPARQAT